MDGGAGRRRRGADGAPSSSSAGDRCAYALCRPPGHHVSATAYGGSCYLNNAAIAAQFLRDAGAASVAVLDIDAHHGNGTQSIFYDRADVYVGSVHVDPDAGWFPHYLGFAEEAGSGAGRGANRNVPLSPRTGDERLAGRRRVGLRGCSRPRRGGHRPLARARCLRLGSGEPARGERRGLPSGVRAGRRSLAPTVVVQEGGYDLAALGEFAVAGSSGRARGQRPSALAVSARHMLSRSMGASEDHLLAARLGAGRVIVPRGALPQPAERLDASGPVRAHEFEVAVDRLDLDATSHRNIREGADGDPEQMAARILSIVNERGKMHNPETGSGGVLMGTVSAVGESFSDPPPLGMRVVPLPSLTLTPLRLDRILAIDPASAQIPVHGTAYVCEAAPWAPLPEDLPVELAVEILDVYGAASHTLAMAATATPSASSVRATRVASRAPPLGRRWAPGR